MNNIRLILLSVIVSFFGCGLEKMVSDYDKVVYSQNPNILEVHGGDIVVDLKAVFPEKYFIKKASVEITPTIVDNNGNETKLKSFVLKGEQSSGPGSTIFYESGGVFNYYDKIEYNHLMLNSTLELRAIASLEDDKKELGPVSIAKGVITTSMRVANDEIPKVAEHNYKEVEIISETATIYFLVNKSNIRTTEKSDEDVQKLRDFIKLGYKTESFVVKSSSSPEGTDKVNTELSDKRQNSTLSYAKYLLKKLKANGSSNDEKYTLSSAGADWDGFSKLVESSKIYDKSTILSLTERNKERTQREKGELLQDMTQVYDALEEDVLQYLRKSEITINSFIPKRTKQDIISLSQTNPSQLSVNELLYSATLDENDLNSKDIYLKVIDLFGTDWRGYNNMAVHFMLIGDTSKARNYLEYAVFNGGHNQSPVITNLGILAAWNGELDLAKSQYERFEIDQLNQGILDLRMGRYKSASLILNEDTYNGSLAKLLNGELEVNCTNKTADCYYIKAISAARSGNEKLLFDNLEKSIILDNIKMIILTKE